MRSVCQYFVADDPHAHDFTRSYRTVKDTFHAVGKLAIVSEFKRHDSTNLVRCDGSFMLFCLQRSDRYVGDLRLRLLQSADQDIEADSCAFDTDSAFLQISDAADICSCRNHVAATDTSNAMVHTLSTDSNGLIHAGPSGICFRSGYLHITIPKSCDLSFGHRSMTAMSTK